MNDISPLTAGEQSLGLALPNRRLEEWKWTDLRRLIDKPYATGPQQPVETAAVNKLLKASPFSGCSFRRIVFVNGEYRAELSKTDGLNIKPHDAPFAIADDVALIGERLKPSGIELTFTGQADTPVEIIHVASTSKPAAMALHNRISVAAGASATVIETFVGEGDYLVVSATSIEVAEGARLDRVKADCENATSTHLGALNVTLGKNSILRDFTLTAGSRLNRQNSTYSFAGEGAEARISGSYLLAGKQHADSRLVIDHQVPHCTSRELFKCVLDDDSRGIFQGKVIVRKHAQKTDGKQSSHALLLSPTAEFDAKPELEIYADDVVCGHGATAGDLNHDHLFYLRSRGIPEAQARSMLVSAFVAEAVETVENENVQEALLNLVEKRLS